MTIGFILNGEDVNARVRSVDRLSDVLHERFGLSGVESDCRCGRCGRCLVFLDGRLVPSCIVPAFRVRGLEVVTIEGFSLTDEYHDVVAGLEAAGVASCGFCESGKILAIAALLERRPRPTRREALEHLSVVPCRCSDPEGLAAAVLAAADARARRLYRRAGI
jgi:carbon-monoxide dehydrogenase small subunit